MSLYGIRTRIWYRFWRTEAIHFSHARDHIRAKICYRIWHVNRIHFLCKPDRD